MLMIITTTIRTGDTATMLIATIYQHQEGVNNRDNQITPINNRNKTITTTTIITITTTNIVTTTLTTITTTESQSANRE